MESVHCVDGVDDSHWIITLNRLYFMQLEFPLSTLFSTSTENQENSNDQSQNFMVLLNPSVIVLTYFHMIYSKFSEFSQIKKKSFAATIRSARSVTRLITPYLPSNRQLSFGVH